MANAMEKRLRRHTGADPHLGDRVAHHAVRGKRKIMEILSWWDYEFWTSMRFTFRRLASWQPAINDVEIEEVGEVEEVGRVEEVMDIDEDDWYDF